MMSYCQHIIFYDLKCWKYSEYFNLLGQGLFKIVLFVKFWAILVFARFSLCNWILKSKQIVFFAKEMTLCNKL